MSFLKKLFSSTPKRSIEDLLADGAVIVDVRSKGEYQSGHLRNSVNIPLDSLKANLSRLKKDKPVITCCASGMRSASAKAILKSNGFAEVVNGGGWTGLRKYDR